MSIRPSDGRDSTPRRAAATATAWRALTLACLLAVSCRVQPCQDPTHDGLCFCPVGQSCHHECQETVANCTLGCSQGNRACSVACADNCTALCAGAGTCDTACGEHCTVSCESVKQRCTARVGSDSHVTCDNAASCDVRCDGACDVSCRGGHCRMRCAGSGPCELTCGDKTATERASICPNGDRVCGEPC